MVLYNTRRDCAFSYVSELDGAWYRSLCVGFALVFYHQIFDSLLVIFFFYLSLQLSRRLSLAFQHIYGWHQQENSVQRRLAVLLSCVCLFVCWFVGFFSPFPSLHIFLDSLSVSLSCWTWSQQTTAPRWTFHWRYNKEQQDCSITSQEYCCAPSACSIRRRLESHRIVVVEISVDIFLSTTASWE